jgi:hypothetical protein
MVRSRVRFLSSNDPLGFGPKLLLHLIGQVDFSLHRFPSSSPNST